MTSSTYSLIGRAMFIINTVAPDILPFFRTEPGLEQLDLGREEVKLVTIDGRRRYVSRNNIPPKYSLISWAISRLKSDTKPAKSSKVDYGRRANNSALENTAILRK